MLEWAVLGSNLVNLDDVKKVVVSLLADDDHFTPERLAEGLVGADMLTRWQAKKLLAGKSQGFYLGSYRLLRPLGKGGMGVVFLGEHHVMKRLMALKVLPSKALDSCIKSIEYDSLPPQPPSRVPLLVSIAGLKKTTTMEGISIF